MVQRMTFRAIPCVIRGIMNRILLGRPIRSALSVNRISRTTRAQGSVKRILLVPSQFDYCYRYARNPGLLLGN